ncbi:hypothetical protein WOLCODRAFT_154578 [Wolfiporia cocos MD-104 SS10]|uniref:F-box domain-containing protein n=1 Tax=Wolfiporia cocos (strain MD-104) TaxID=742152 RepID=A0A2H3K324_WOLCO|nr:hypothetical protein WOLCODRAFT_154578 [Wolfiporia cocos MD-104 SS10]
MPPRSYLPSKVQVFSKQLPPEIWIVVLSHLVDDRRSLKVCAFVCRAWLSTTRPYLLQTVRIHNLSTCTEIDASIDTSPDMARYVRKLHVGPIHGTDFSSRDEDMPDVWSCCLRLLGKLKGIRKLAIDLDHEWIDLIPKNIQGRLPGLLEGVETLVLKNVLCRGGLASLQGMLLACRRLSCLYLDVVRFPDDDGSPYHRHGATINHKEILRTFVYNEWEASDSSEDLLRWLASGEMNFSPSRVDLARLTDGTWDVLRAAGDSLEYLTVDLSWPVSCPPTAPAFACNTWLASIEIVRFDLRTTGALGFLSNIGATNTGMRQLGLSLLGSVSAYVSSDASIRREVDSHLARLARSLPALVVTLYFHYCFYGGDDIYNIITELVDNLTLFREARSRLVVCWSATPEQYQHAQAVDLDLKQMCQPNMEIRQIE